MVTELKEPESEAMVPRGDVDLLMVEAVRSGNIEVMERVMAIRRELKAEAAKEAFYDSFAQFQAELPIIKKTKWVKSESGSKLYAYAPLDVIVKQCGKIISRHGFSYTIKPMFEDPSEHYPLGRVGALCRVQHTAGHFEESPFWIPVKEATRFTNTAQQSGTALAYAKRYAFCFAGETEIITHEGIARLDALVGKSVVLLSRAESGFAKWVKASVKAFGEQPLMKLTLRRCGRKKVIYTTPNHRWIVRKWKRKDAECVKTTAELKPGYILPTVFPKIINTKAVGAKGIRPSAYGIVHGFMFGDGSAPIPNTRQNYAASITLYGAKDAELIKYFPPATHISVALKPGQRGYNVGALQAFEIPRYFKQSPLGLGDDSASYLFGWLAGYFAADGTVAKDGEATLCSAEVKNLRIAETVACRLGFRTFSIQSRLSSNGFKVNANMSRMAFQKGTLPVDFFLLGHHRSRIVTNGDMLRDRSNWRVESVEVTKRVETVYCAVVPQLENFILADNVLTKNCPAFGIATEDEDTDGIIPNEARKAREAVSQPKPTPSAQKAAQRANGAQAGGNRPMLEPAGEGEGIDAGTIKGLTKAMEHAVLGMSDFKTRFPALSGLEQVKKSDTRVVLSWIANPVEK